MKKIFRLAKYLLLSMVFIAFAFLRGVTGWSSDNKSPDARKLSKDDLQKLLHVPKANADVTGDDDAPPPTDSPPPGGDDDGGDDDGGDGDGGGC